MDISFEYSMAEFLASQKNIKWWHKNIARTGFCINGFVNAYPDFIAMTENGMILVIETKGDHLVENIDSRHKLKIGRKWAILSGLNNYRYYMVSQNKDIGEDGAYRFDAFKKIIEGL
jgi:type III restriction enzyme